MINLKSLHIAVTNLSQLAGSIVNIEMSYPLISTPLFHFLAQISARWFEPSLLQRDKFQLFFDRHAHGGLFILASH